MSVFARTNARTTAGGWVQRKSVFGCLVLETFLVQTQTSDARVEIANLDVYPFRTRFMKHFQCDDTS